MDETPQSRFRLLKSPKGRRTRYALIFLGIIVVLVFGVLIGKFTGHVGSSSNAKLSSSCRSHHGICVTITATIPITTTTGTTTTPAGVFTTSLTDSMTISTPYVWTFDPGVSTTAGQFWADGTKLASITGPGPYTFTLPIDALSSGAHTLGHSWDTPDGVHHSPPNSYSVVISNPVTTTGVTTTVPTPPPPPVGTVLFDGRATRMNALSSTGLSSTNNIVQSQDPLLWDCICFTNNDITLQSDSRYGKVYNVSVGPGSRNPWNTSAPTNTASGELSKGRPNDMGKWDWFAEGFKITSSMTAPGFITAQQYEYPTLSSPPLSFSIANLGGGLTWFLSRNSGLLTVNSGGWPQGAVFQQIPLVPLASITGKWEEFILGVKWATDNTGEIRVYARTEGETNFALILSLSNTPTMQYGCTSYGCVSADYHESPNIIDHGGLYFGFWDTRTSFADESLKFTGMTRSDTYDAARSLLP